MFVYISQTFIGVLTNKVYQKLSHLMENETEKSWFLTDVFNGWSANTSHVHTSKLRLFKLQFGFMGLF